MAVSYPYEYCEYICKKLEGCDYSICPNCGGHICPDLKDCPLCDDGFGKKKEGKEENKI